MVSSIELMKTLLHFVGSHFTMMVGIFSYMADITKESERTVRIGIISLTYSVGIPFGMAFSGILIKYVVIAFDKFHNN